LRSIGESIHLRALRLRPPGLLVVALKMAAASNGCHHKLLSFGCGNAPPRIADVERRLWSVGGLLRLEVAASVGSSSSKGKECPPCCLWAVGEVCCGGVAGGES
jgi:hypothetical protein